MRGAAYQFFQPKMVFLADRDWLSVPDALWLSFPDANKPGGERGSTVLHRTEELAVFRVCKGSTGQCEDVLPCSDSLCEREKRGGILHGTVLQYCRHGGAAVGRGLFVSVSHSADVFALGDGGVLGGYVSHLPDSVALCRIL